MQDGAYLCNMGVDATYRRRGYGKLLLQAAEQVTREAGFTRMYLHLRFWQHDATVILINGYRMYCKKRPVQVSGQACS